MRLHTFVVSALAGLALANIKELQAQLPACSPLCFAQAAIENGCAVNNLACQCAKPDETIRVVSPCLVKAGCRLKELSEAATISAQICAEVAAAGGLPAPTPAAAEPSTIPGAGAHISPASGWGTVAVVVILAAVL